MRVSVDLYIHKLCEYHLGGGFYYCDPDDGTLVYGEPKLTAIVS
jgi:hypothetical protein